MTIYKSIMHQIMAWQDYDNKHRKKICAARDRVSSRSYPDPERPTLYFTYREIEIIQFLSKRMTYRQIGASTGLSDRTIECHVRRMRIKTGLVDRLALVEQARRWGLI